MMSWKIFSFHNSHPEGVHTDQFRKSVSETLNSNQEVNPICCMQGQYTHTWLFRIISQWRLHICNIHTLNLNFIHTSVITNKIQQSLQCLSVICTVFFTPTHFAAISLNQIPKKYVTSLELPTFCIHIFVNSNFPSQTLAIVLSKLSPCKHHFSFWCVVMLNVTIIIKVLQNLLVPMICFITIKLQAIFTVS